MKALLIFLAILYIINPADLLPDIMPLLGWLDDAFVLGVLLYFLRRGSLPKFLSWLNRFSINKDTNQTGSSQGQTGPEAHNDLKQEKKDPYEILGITPDADPIEVKEAYRRAVQMYHPDKVTHLGPEFQDLARRKFLEVQQAFDSLSGKKRTP